MLVCRLVGVVGIAALLAAPARGQNTIYSHDFNGSSTTPLLGLPADVDGFFSGNTWVTRTDTATPTGTGKIFYADGEMLGNDGLGTGTGGAGSATLAFTPTAGSIYTLSASLGAVTATGANWVGLGFAAGQSSAGGSPGRFISAPTSGQPWMIYRGPNADATTPTPDASFTGPGTAGQIDWSTPVTDNRGAPIDLRIVLNTTQAAWTAEWFAKKPADTSYTSVGFHTYATNPTIGAVGIALAHGSVQSSISSFRLETTGEVCRPGDVNCDGEVDLDDFVLISDNLFNIGMTRADGDLNGDGIVDFADFKLWKEVFEAGGGSAVGLFVPEPASSILGGLALLCVAGIWRRARR